MTSHPDIDPAILRTAFATVPNGVVAICAMHDGRPVGMAVSAFVTVSLDPPLVGVCIRRESATWPVLRASARLGVSVLGEQHAAAARKLASTSADRFAGVAFDLAEQGAIAVDGCPTFLSCVPEQEVDAGDHLFALLRIVTLRTRPSRRPLVFHCSRFGGVQTQHAQPA